MHGIKPKKPAGAFRIFLQEKAKNNEIKTIQDGHELWKKLSEEQKMKYEEIKEKIERKSNKIISFGQTPFKLFEDKHPQWNPEKK